MIAMINQCCLSPPGAGGHLGGGGPAAAEVRQRGATSSLSELLLFPEPVLQITHLPTPTTCTTLSPRLHPDPTPPPLHTHTKHHLGSHPDAPYYLHAQPYHSHHHPASYLAQVKGHPCLNFCCFKVCVCVCVLVCVKSVSILTYTVCFGPNVK